LNAITVNLTLATPAPGQAVEGLDFAALPRTLSFPVGVSSQTISVTPLANPNLLAPVLATVQLAGGTGYSLGTATRASIAIYPSATANGTGLTGQYFTNSSSTYSNSANFKPANLVMTRVDPTVDFVWGTTTSPITNSGYYTVRWTGQVEPEYSETYYFDANTDDGVRVWVNNQIVIDSWVSRGAADSIGTISLQGGVRYNIQMDYFQGGGNAAAHLSWYSPSQPKQVIPSSRLYPASVPPAPAVVTSPQSAVAFLGQPFSFTVTGANGANAFTASGLPPGLNFNGASGVISGVPTISGDYQVALTASNPIGLGAGVLDLLVIDTGSSVTREVWLGVPGTNVADIPVSVPASQTNTLATLEGITGFGQNYGERVRGYLTAPVTGNYYFWIAGSDSAELWISNDGEPVNKVRRAHVSPAFATAPRQWTLEPNQQSPWLTLVAGQQYYLEILHKAGSGTNDNWSVGWVQDPMGTNTVPGGVVPGYVLSRYFPPAPAAAQGTLYTANLLPDDANG
ncbi:MAG: PA14 domain-containing protein, partial [Limisphaerales bacterium]